MQKTLQQSISIIALLLLSLVSQMSFAANTTPANQRSDVKEFINIMVDRYHFNQQQLNNLFSQISIQPLPKATKSNQPIEAKPWYYYRDRFVTQKRISDGVKFWHQYASALQRAQQKYGVPASIIVAIIGVESNYGQITGKHQVFGALSNIAFSNSRRAAYFKKELVQFLLLCKEQGFNPLTVTGSYAGAIGQPQFMPSSYRAYAVKFAGNKSSDLMHNEVDIIGSVANYFHKNGWKRGQIIAIPVTLKKSSNPRLPEPTFRPKYTEKELQAFDIIPAQTVPTYSKARFIELQGDKGMQYWLGLKNFYVITRYNQSTNYAMAVYQLSQALQHQYSNN
jgi:membrane-bound lytic murein transglycosylase B